ncbi:lipid scramblase CLPTM1L-like [Antedon mediterranea]|uniref:lipid scramblase CLPTM1L-like n=1 Tax=Antedon mediterranea TaxID=105859 RepID=UPI003AF5FF26
MSTTLTYIFVGAFIIFMAHSMHTMYNMFSVKPCAAKDRSKCIHPQFASSERLQLSVYTSMKSKISKNNLELILKVSNFNASLSASLSVNISLPQKACKQEGLKAYVFVHKVGTSPFSNQEASKGQLSLTQLRLPKEDVYNLLSNISDQMSMDSIRPVLHYKPTLYVSVVPDYIIFDKENFPFEIYKYFEFTRSGKYLPILFINELGIKYSDLVLMNSTTCEMPLSIEYTPISVGKLRLFTNLQQSMVLMQELGFGQKDLDEMRGLLTGNNLFILSITAIIAMLHALFDILAFKNDISYWRNQDRMTGMSTSTVLWCGFSQIVIFFYLMDEDTSLLVVIPAGIGAIIEVWKIKKAFKISFSLSGYRPIINKGECTKEEKATNEINNQAMVYLSYLLGPICIGLAVYSLLYVSYKSWYSWLIHSLANGVYAFGFLFMLPQLFVNHKLKSVSHLPWRVFMYKALNTFIDDLCAFVITMPTTHRVACFRDDVVFVIYLYQRWLYPVDKSRKNEYGISYENEDTMKHKNKKTKKE